MDAARALERKVEKRMLRISPRSLRWASLVIVWAGWESVAYSGIYLQDVFPSTLRVMRVLGMFLADAAFYSHASITLGEVVLAFAIGTGIGVLVGMAMGAWLPVGRAAEPYVSGLMATPRIVWFPVALMLFGSGIGSKVALGALGAFFPTVLYAYAAMLAVSPVHKKVAKVFHASQLDMVRKVYLPSIWRPLLVGSQIALGVTITPVLLAEMKNSAGGLGFLVMEHYNNFQITEMYAVLAFLFFFIVAMNSILNQLIAHAGRGMSRHPLGRTD